MNARIRRLALFLIVYFLMLRPVKTQVLTALRELPTRMARSSKELGGAATAAAVAVEIEPPGAEQARRATALKRQLSEKVKTEPAVASRLVQSWMRDGGKE